MIKVIEVIGALKDGGAETLVKNYVDLIDKRVFDVMILSIYPMNNTANHRHIFQMGIKSIAVYRYYNIAVRIFNRVFGRWYVPYRLARIVKQEAPDCIHLNSPVAWLFAAIQPGLNNIRLFYTCHSEPSKYFISGEKNEETAVKKLICENGMRLIALHEDMRSELNQRFSVTDTVVVNNGVDFKRYSRPEWDTNQIRHSIGIPKNAFLVVHVGRFAAVKNHSFLLDIFSEIKKRRNNAHLLLIGDGPLKRSVCEQIKQKDLIHNVTILSHRTDVPELLYASNLMIMPSRYEGLSVALVEAQVSGLRCLVSDSVNRANFLTEKTIPVSLHLNAKEWAQVALDESVKNTSYGDLVQFDLGLEIRKLEHVYSQ